MFAQHLGGTSIKAAALPPQLVPHSRAGGLVG